MTTTDRRSAAQTALWAQPEHRAKRSAAISKGMLEADHPRCISVMIDGVSYRSISAARRALNLSAAQVKRLASID